MAAVVVQAPFASDVRGKDPSPPAIRRGRRTNITAGGPRRGGGHTSSLAAEGAIFPHAPRPPAPPPAAATAAAAAARAAAEEQVPIGSPVICGDGLLPFTVRRGVPEGSARLRSAHSQQMWVSCLRGTGQKGQPKVSQPALPVRQKKQAPVGDAATLRRMRCLAQRGWYPQEKERPRASPQRLAEVTRAFRHAARNKALATLPQETPAAAAPAAGDGAADGAQPAPPSAASQPPPEQQPQQETRRTPTPAGYEHIASAGSVEKARRLAAIRQWEQLQRWNFDRYEGRHPYERPRTAVARPPQRQPYGQRQREQGHACEQSSSGSSAPPTPKRQQGGAGVPAGRQPQRPSSAPPGSTRPPPLPGACVRAAAEAAAAAVTAALGAAPVPPAAAALQAAAELLRQGPPGGAEQAAARGGAGAAPAPQRPQPTPWRPPTPVRTATPADSEDVHPLRDRLPTHPAKHLFLNEQAREPPVPCQRQRHVARDYHNRQHIHLPLAPPGTAAADVIRKRAGAGKDEECDSPLPLPGPRTDAEGRKLPRNAPLRMKYRNWRRRRMRDYAGRQHVCDTNHLPWASHAGPLGIKTRPRGRRRPWPPHTIPELLWRAVDGNPRAHCL
eukprot:TRINITY_DN10073_c0_g2_i1.p1 TRINITY_DN10073_c0_g2~~TRINITY_DN10073_c0_g2_i1.p1  ORF type:complete len:614 (+),score=109.37 TRINITY_DN10073_c0_g2_i1:86-1927(+)